MPKGNAEVLPDQEIPVTALLAGVGTCNITPPVGTSLAGRPKTYPTYTIHDPLQAKAVYLEQNHTRAILISVDLLLLEHTECLPMRQAIAQTLNMPLHAVIICATHTHTGPGVGNWSAWPGRETYENRLFQNILQAAQDAQSSAQPAQLSYASTERTDLCHNRRYVMANGRVETHPERECALFPDGPIDPQIQAVHIKDRFGNPMAILAHFACHPTAMGWKDNAISADYPHWIEITIQAQLGNAIPVVFFPGALGDVSDGGPFTRQQQVGTGLAGQIGQQIGLEILKSNNHPISGTLIAKNIAIQVPTIDMGPARQAWAKNILHSPDQHLDTDVRDARMILDMCHTWPAQIATEIPLIAIGDLAVYGVPGELFCWYGLQLKKHSRFRYPIVLGLANDRIGYIADRVFPTKDIFNQPLSFNTRPFGQTGDAGELLVQAALEL